MIDVFPTLDESFAQRLAWTLFHFVWEGAVIGAAFGVGRVALRRRSPNARYVLGCLCLLLMAVAPVLTYAQFVATDAAVATSAVPPIFSEPLAGATRVGVSLDRPSVAQQLGDFVSRHTPLLTRAWMFGVAVMVLRQVGGWWFLRHVLRRTNLPIPQPEVELVDRLRRRMGIGRLIQVFESRFVDVPATLGWIRPVILLPPCALTGLPPEHLEALIAHELAHIRRYDFALGILQTAIETLLFFHPAVWVISAYVRRDREECCDAVAAEALKSPRRYAEALILMEEVRFALPSPAMSAGGGSLTHRIARLLGHPQRKLGHSGRTGLVGAVLAAAVVGLVGNQLFASTFVYQQVRAYAAPQSLAAGVYRLFAQEAAGNDEPLLSALVRSIDRMNSGGLPDEERRLLIDALFEARPQTLLIATVPHARAHAGVLIEGGPPAGKFLERHRLREALLAGAVRQSSNLQGARREALAALLFAAQETDLFGPTIVSAVLADRRFIATARLNDHEHAALQGLLADYKAIAIPLSLQQRRTIIASEALRASPGDVAARHQFEDALALLRALGDDRYDKQWFEARLYASALKHLPDVDKAWMAGLLAERRKHASDPHVVRWFDEAAQPAPGPVQRTKPPRYLKPDEVKKLRPLSL